MRKLGTLSFAVAVYALMGSGVAAAQDLTSLMHAAKQGHTDTVRALLDGGADVDARNKYGYTALMFGAINGSTNSVRALLAGGADVNAKTRYGTSVLMLAAFTGQPEVVNVLLDSGADVNAKGKYGTALDFAIGGIRGPNPVLPGHTGHTAVAGLQGLPARSAYWRVQVTGSQLRIEGMGTASTRRTPRTSRLPRGPLHPSCG